MPLPKRVVEPVHVARGTIPEDFPLPSELEAATNGTLANTVRQLSSLSRHAEDLFGELTREAHVLAARANSLQTRIDRLAVKVTQLDSNVEEVSLQDIHMRKAFKSSVVFDQQVVSRDTMPTAMLETYQTCDKPPPLDKLNSYREDGKDGLKFYTDANYFFDLWRQEMLKDTERMMHDRGKKPHRPRNEGGGGRHKKRVRQPHNTRERQRQLAVGHGEYIMPQNVHYRTPQQPDETLLTMGMVMSDPRPPRPNSIELRRSYPDQVEMVYSGNSGVYSPRHTQSPTESHYRSTYPVGYEESLYQQHYAQGQSVAGESYPTPNNHTPSRSNGTRATTQRPSQPPPAPPSTNNSSNSTPTVSSATNTPTRGRSMSAGRETLPPPPPPPVETVGSPPGMNGPLPSHLRSRSRSGSRSGSPLPVSTHSTPTPPSNHNTPHSHSLSRDNTPEPQQLPQTELPPPPPTPEQQQQQQQQQQQTVPSPPAPLSAQQRPTSPPCNIPPPPPPPPPPPMTLPNGPLSPPPACGVPMSPPLVNGDVGKSPLKQIISTSPPKQSPPKTENPARNKLANPPAPAFDPRSDLLKAIRDGIKLRKVEKNEQKEVERVNALHDVASILARRVAVEFSDSDSASESEYDSEGWGEQETSA